MMLPSALAGHLPFDVDLVQGERWPQPSGLPVRPGVVDRRGHVVAGEPGRPGSLHRAERERADVPVRVLEGAGAEIHDRRRRGAGQHRIRQVTPLGVRACLVVRGPLPAVGPLSVTCLVQLPGVGGVLDRPAIVLRRPGRAGGRPPPAGGCSRSRSAATRSGPGSAAARRLPPRRPTAPRTSRRGRCARHDRIAEHHLDGDRRPAAGGMIGSGRASRVGARDGTADRPTTVGVTDGRLVVLGTPKVTGVVGPTVVVGADAPVDRRPRDRASGGGVRRTAGRDTGGRSAARLEGPGRRCGHRREPRIGAHRQASDQQPPTKRRISSHRRARRVGHDRVCRARHLRQGPIRRRRRLGRAQRVVGGVHVGHHAVPRIGDDTCQLGGHRGQVGGGDGRQIGHPRRVNAGSARHLGA